MSALFRNPFFKSYSVACPDGPRTVYRNVDDVFPLHLKYAKTAVGASAKGLEHIQAHAEFKNEERIGAVLVKLDQLNQSMQVQFRAAYAVFQASPCTELPYFRAAVEKIIVDEQKLRSVRTIIDQMNAMFVGRPKGAPLDQHMIGVIDAQLSQAVAALLPEPQRQLAEKMAEVPRITAEWKGDE